MGWHWKEPRLYLAAKVEQETERFLRDDVLGVVEEEVAIAKVKLQAARFIE